MASSSVTASSINRPRVAVAVTSAIIAASLGYYYYQYYRLADQLDFDSLEPEPGSGSRLHRRNALRRLRRPNRTQDESSGDDSPAADADDADDAAVLSPPPLNDAAPQPASAVPVLLQDEQPEEWWNDSSLARQRTGENIVTLLFRVSEDNARRNAYVHRGCLCNGCGMLPIRGIRYRCANCPDFDLCEMCESQGSHNKAHVFYKVKIPVPSSAARHVQPPWYPGDPNNVVQTLPRSLLQRWSSETGFERVELDALWEQWTFMANTEWREDPNFLCLAMDRKTFERCLVPSAGYRHPAPNLVHDRMFAFYDTNNDGLIGFEEYLHGVSYKRRKDKLKRTFDGYDLDGDGYVSRRDFLRMYRAYYVSYKQMHQDTVEGLDDYMLNNVEVQQLVNSRQPISSLFGRDQRIPYAEDNPGTGGKVFRSNGEVDVHDGKGAVNEDRPDTASREDVLRDLFTRNSTQSLFTESFGPSSRRPQSPARDSRYWSGILDPPRNTGDLAALLTGDHAQLDDILYSIRHRRASRVFVADDVESGSSDDDADESTADPIDEDGETSQPQGVGIGNHDEAQDVMAAAEFINTMPTEIRFQSQRETFASPQQMYSDKRKRVLARKQLYERWKRRQFYLDEEEGAMPPQGWRDEEDVLASMNENAESSKSAPPPISPRSRSSSKVRFVEDTDDFETRSNHSTSSRSVPERWGGMEIPDAERDAGKEIFYQVAQQAFNELLDLLFKEKEDRAVLAAETKEQREKYRQLLDDFELQDEDDKFVDSPKPPASRQSPIRRPVHRQSLQELLTVSGYTVANANASDEARSPEPVDHSNGDVEQAPRDGQATSARRDPTMPQFMPNNDQTSSTNEWDAATASTTKAPMSEQEGQSAPNSDIPRPDAPGDIPRGTLVTWKILDQAEQEARERRGWGRLNYAEFEKIYREHEFQEGSKNRLAYLGSWIDFCIPS